MKIKEGIIQGVIAVAFVCAFVAAVNYWKAHSPNKQDLKLRELRELVTHIPKFPDFSEETTDESSRPIDAGIYRCYYSNGSYEEIKAFYNTALTSQGWSVAKEERVRRWFMDFGSRKIVFEKEGFSIAIEVTLGARRCRCSISYVWDDSSWSS